MAIQSVQEVLDPIYTDLTFVSSRLQALQHLLDNGCGKDIDAGAVPGISSMIEREQREIDRLGGELEDVMRKAG